VARTPEGAVKDKVVAVLKKYGVYYFFPATYGMGRSGVPDIICCVSGRFLAIECKAGKGKPTALQMHEINSILSAGGSALIINEVSLPEVELKLQAMLGDGGFS
jgi:Holliday junction resolvase